MSDSLNQISRTAPGSVPDARRLGKNVNGYFGETIDIGGVMADCRETARAKGWTLEEIHPAPRSIVAFKREAGGSVGRAVRRIYISTGIHGDEPAGPLAGRQLLREDKWPADLELWLCPCLNPGGFELNRRENPEGVDLNREYRAPKTMETVSHVAWLERQPPFDACLCLHEDWESPGFYVYELNPDNAASLAETIVAAVKAVCPLDLSEIIEDRAAKGGIIRPNLDPALRPQWPEAFYLITHKTRRSCTLEAPSDFELSVRVSALVAGVNAALKEMG